MCYLLRDSPLLPRQCLLQRIGKSWQSGQCQNRRQDIGGGRCFISFVFYSLVETMSYRSDKSIPPKIFSLSLPAGWLVKFLKINGIGKSMKSQVFFNPNNSIRAPN